MTRSLRLLAGLVTAATTLVLAGAAVAAPASDTFSVTGVEYAFTPTVGYFVGSATGDAGDRGAWNTYVEHEPLGSPPPIHVTGGRFWMGTRSPSWDVDWVRGTFVNGGGTITKVDPGANCTNERYLVTGALENVATSTTSGGSGSFSVTLTHYRTSIFGRCVTYSASVVGTVSFVY